MRFDDLLTVRQVAPGAFEAVPEGDGFQFGGLTLALGLRAASLTLGQAMAPKSLRANFMRPGKWGAPTAVSVQTLMDGRSLALRQITLSQEERALAVMTASFHVGSADRDWQEPPAAELIAPARLAPSPVMLPVAGLVELRTVRPTGGDPLGAPAHPYWAKAVEPLGDDQTLNSAVLAFMSDYLVILTMLGPAPELAAPTGVRTIDHGVWFHRPADAEDWLLFTAEPVSIANGKGLARGSVRALDGTLVASFVQEVGIPE
jgi:acyl-CoA thioesterase-2